MEYNFTDIEKKWQVLWEKAGVYKVENQSSRPPFYVLDMFPYPSGAGLHVGHPMGYIASDIYSRYKRLCGFNVLHPMGFDAYGLPAEQYAIQTGQHPEITTRQNIEHYIEQLKKIGFCFDWDRMVITCDPAYYKWTQWAFLQMFNAYYDPSEKKAKSIQHLIDLWEQTDPTWKRLSEKQQQERLMNYRLAYLSDTKVNWCPQLGTVLANDEVSEGLSVRGGYPVEQRIMRQWSLRISAYAQRLLDGLETIDWSDALKETQRNWIGRSEGCEIDFKLKGHDTSLTIFTTRADTIFGVTFVVLSPENTLISQIVTSDKKADVEAYITMVKNRTERERIANRQVSGVFTGAFAIHPFTGEEIPIYISDYVLSGYGTGAIMAVPAHDSRDYAFAKHFNLPIIPIIADVDVSEQSFDAKEGVMVNSDFLNGLDVKEAIGVMKKRVMEAHLGQVKTNYRLRDAIFSRQRYWGEPFPIYYKDGMPYAIPEQCLPLTLPQVTDFKPNANGEPPLANAKQWAWDTVNNAVVDNQQIDNKTVFPLELCTMPGFAGSSAYYLRYMDNHNEEQLVSRAANDYWQQVNLYIGGIEHATGHLIYSRFWNKVLFDLGYVCKEEPFKKLINQGMIQGRSNFVYRYVGEGASGNLFVSYNLIDNPQYKGKVQPIHVDVNMVKNDVLDIAAFKAWMPEFRDASFVYSDGSTDVDNPYLGSATEKQYICGWAVEKMSKSMFNVVNPDYIIDLYGADTLRMYEMFLGPVELSKPWDTNGIDGVFRFLKKTWNLFENIDSAEPTDGELKIIHRLIKKITEDIENFSFNTSISAFMIAVNDLSKLNSRKRSVLRTMAILLSPFAPHIAEEMWERTRLDTDSERVCQASWPQFEEKYTLDDTFTCPIQCNGKVRFTMELAKGLTAKMVEEQVLADPRLQQMLQGKTVKKVIVVPNRIVNIVV